MDYKAIDTIFADAQGDSSHQLMIIVGHAAKQQKQIGAYMFERYELPSLRTGIIKPRGGVTMAPPVARFDKKIGLSLSGGGSRAVAFHLGTLRALEDLQLLDEVDIISGVSGGSVMTGLVGYTDAPFTEIDKNTLKFLRRGLVKPALMKLLHFTRLVRLLVNRMAVDMPNSYSCTHVMAEAVADMVGTHKCDAPTRQDKSIVFNACELRTGTAFRMSNECFGSYRYGWAPAKKLRVADAIMASAAYPPFLPPYDWTMPFEKNGQTKIHRVIITDGGVFENLGVSVMEPGRNPEISKITFNPDIIITSDAGTGQFTGESLPINWAKRMLQVVSAIMRKVGDATKKRLHDHARTGRIDDFVYVDLGQMDHCVPLKPANWVSRDDVINYSVHFFAMPEETIQRLSRRGELITRALVTQYLLTD